MRAITLRQSHLRAKNDVYYFEGFIEFVKVNPETHKYFSQTDQTLSWQLEKADNVVIHHHRGFNI
jgi:CHASE3 domain sensor protein